jgi:hypothetical protein
MPFRHLQSPLCNASGLNLTALPKREGALFALNRYSAIILPTAAYSGTAIAFRPFHIPRSNLHIAGLPALRHSGLYQIGKRLDRAPVFV